MPMAVKCAQVICMFITIGPIVVVYYCRTYMKAVRGGGSEEGGRVLWDATSRGLCGRVGPPRTNVRVAWANCERGQSR